MRKEPLEEDLDYIARYPLQYEQLKDTTVLVTGATGLIGVSIVRALIAIGNIHVIALVRNIEKLDLIRWFLLSARILRENLKKLLVTELPVFAVSMM